MQVSSTLSDSYSLQFFELLESFHLAHNKKIENNKRYYLIDHITEDYPPGYDYYFVENNAEILNLMGKARKYIDDGSADLMLGSFLHPKHSLYSRTVSLPRDYINCNLWYTHPYYFTSNFFVDKPRNKNLTFINGQNRSIRNYLMHTLKPYCDLVLNNDGINIIETQCNSYCSFEDKNFVQYCNNLYKENLLSADSLTHVSFNWFSFGDSFGNNKGEARLGYIPIDEYMTSRCIVYPETTFFNYELYPTEKTWKCVKAKTHWIMFAGAGSYEIMNNLGFTSIVELCPADINDFDTELDHVKRIEKIEKCCEWIQNNPDVLTCTEADRILQKNFENFHKPAIIVEQAMKTFERYL